MANFTESQLLDYEGVFRRSVEMSKLFLSCTAASCSHISAVQFLQECAEVSQQVGQVSKQINLLKPLRGLLPLCRKS